MTLIFMVTWASEWKSHYWKRAYMPDLEIFWSSFVSFSIKKKIEAHIPVIFHQVLTNRESEIFWNVQLQTGINSETFLWFQRKLT